MSTVELICINCPLGCMLSVEREGDRIISVKGNTCPRGEKYARQEVTDPRRTVTTTIRTERSIHPRLSVKTVPDVPKASVFRVVEEARKLVVHPPIRIGDVIKPDIANTGSALVATSDLLQ